MKNIKLTIEYDGTNYNGWQAQNSITFWRLSIFITANFLILKLIVIIGILFKNNTVNSTTALAPRGGK